jgi:protein-S-isoprenylcysteine O-methyltransferase Ste14
MISLLALACIVIGTIAFSVLYIISVQPASLALRIGERAYPLCGRVRMAAMVFEMLTLGGYMLFIFGDTWNYQIVEHNALLIQVPGGIIALITLGFMVYSTIIAGREAAAPRRESTLYGGIYHYMRHPQTLGEMLSWFGIAMVLNSLPLLLYSIIWIPLFISYTVLEDNDLAVRFGKDYIEYARKVGIFWRKKAVRGR